MLSYYTLTDINNIRKSVYTPITKVDWSVFFYFNEYIVMNHICYATIYVGYPPVSIMQISEVNTPIQDFEVSVLNYIENLTRNDFYIESKKAIGSPFMIPEDSWRKKATAAIWHYMPSNPDTTVRDMYEQMIHAYIDYARSLFSVGQIENVYETYFKNMFDEDK